MPYDKRPPERVLLSAFVFIAVIYIIVSFSIAMATEDDCDGFPKKTWKMFPPGWECKVR